jgi:hypothetical protein
MHGVVGEAEGQKDYCEQYDDTTAQKEHFERAKETYEAIEKLYNDCLEEEKEAQQCE